ncbi:MAG: hypothetical protein HY043_06925 [Verrucomicrobia bacterium]|nr:hypothetical protein [Verrucomicrobiota bacterium]
MPRYEVMNKPDTTSPFVRWLAPSRRSKEQDGRAAMSARRGRKLPLLGSLVMAMCALVFSASASLQFDVFLGYDGTIREGEWFPVACEILNDGPSFKAVFEFGSESGGRTQTRRFALELPTNTRKRFSIPAFASAGRFARWNARLLDERGRVRADRPNLQAKDRPWDSPLIAAIPRSFNGMPELPKGVSRTDDSGLGVLRLIPDQFPDHLLALESLDALYLSSEKAIDLKVNQVQALLAWLNGGGHLVVAVEQPGDLAGTPWLRSLLPCELNSVVAKPIRGELQKWLTSERNEAGLNSKTLASTDSSPRRRNRMNARDSSTLTGDPIRAQLPDEAFDQAELSVAVGSLRDGKPLLELDGTPAIIQARRGRGLVTVLAFSPEREPFRSWKNRSWFWAKLLDVPAHWFTQPDSNRYGGVSLDGVIGSMIDSTQVRKLPVTWLLALLIVYLVVIGPLDQFWLKRLNRQMLTWITFPAYVAFFSGLIYFIGYRLRAGETEWNELTMVDVLPRGPQVELRGRTYASVYSPVNARYELVSDQPYASLRGEFQGAWAGGLEQSRSAVEQRVNGYRGEIDVPVWTSQLFVSDWLQPGNAPLTAKAVSRRGKIEVEISSALSQRLDDVRLALNGKVYPLGAFAPNQSRKITLDEAQEGRGLPELLNAARGEFSNAVQYRRQAVGRDIRVGKSAENLIAASIASRPEEIIQNGQFFVSPRGMDVGAAIDRGEAVLFAWSREGSVINPAYRFTPKRSHRETLLRLSVPLTAAD